jgi:peptidase M42 family hydrolase
MTDLSIDLVYLKYILNSLLHIPSPTGYTKQITQAVCAELKALGVDHEITQRGAIRARVRGGKARPARAMVSHLDTLGAQVKRLKDNGRLELVPIGNWSARFAEGARTVVVTDSGGRLTGTILPIKASGHTFNEEIDTLPVCWASTELRVDAHAESAEDLALLGLDVGDIVTIDPMPEFLDNGYIVSRHLDNKAGVAIMLASLKALIDRGERPAVDIYWLFTIAEEIGYGANAILTPEMETLVAVDNGTTAPGQSSSEYGATIAMADQTGPFDYDLTRALVRLCRQGDIPFQKDIFRYYRSDAASAVEGGGDVRTALITFGIDSSHGYERIHTHALSSVAQLCLAHALSGAEDGENREIIPTSTAA